MNPSILDSRRGASPFYVGWAGFAAFGVLVLLGGHAGWGYAAFHVAVAAALCAFFALTTGKAAPIVSLIPGTLFLLQMGMFVADGFLAFDGGADELFVRLSDGFGLLMAILIMAGSVLSIRERR